MNLKRKDAKKQRLERWVQLSLARHGGRLFQCEERLIDLVCDNDAIINRAEPPRHNDADGAGMVEPRKFFGELHGNLETFEFCPKGCAAEMCRVTFDGSRRG